MMSNVCMCVCVCVSLLEQGDEDCESHWDLMCFSHEIGTLIG